MRAKIKALHLSVGDSAPGSLRMADPVPTVLVVDGDHVFREFQAQTLCDQGYNVLKASGAAEALRLADTTAAIHLLLTDLNLPGIDGLELTHRFRAVHPETPVLMFTCTPPLLGHQTVNLERLAVLGKPFDVNELLRKVRTLLEGAARFPLQRWSGSPPG